MNEKLRNELRTNVFFAVVGIICLVYLVRGFVTVVEKGKTVWEILADGALSAGVGFLVSKLLSLQGLAKGACHPQVVATTRLHADTVESVADRIDRLDRWCELKNEENLRVGRSKVLATAGLSYEEYLVDCYTLYHAGEAVTVGYEGLPPAKRRAVRRARRLRLTPLTAGALTSDCVHTADPYDFGPDKRRYERRRDLAQVASKVACGLLFGYFGVQLLTDFGWEGLIWTAIQVAAFVAMGCVSYLRAYYFVVDYDRHRVIRKIDNLQKFKVWSEQHEKERNELEEMVSGQSGA